ncbi:MAG TPA: hypothetical protein VGG75_19635 [Trebonia sp.]
MTRPGADLIAFYLDPDRLPVARRWSRSHASMQQSLCERFVALVIAEAACEDVTVVHAQKIVNAAPTSGEGERVRSTLSAMVNAGIDAGYLANPRLAKVHWQAGDRAVPEAAATVAGESRLWVDPAEIPPAGDVGALGRALAVGRRGALDELMAQTAAYSGLRWGELVALGVDQVDPDGRVISVNRKVVEVRGHLYVETPKNRKFRRTIYPRVTPDGYPLASRLASRIAEVRTKQPDGADVSHRDREVLAIIELQPDCSAARVQYRGMAGRCREARGGEAVDVAQLAACFLHHGVVHVEARRDRRVADGRSCQLPGHAGYVRRDYIGSSRPSSCCH